MLRFGVVLGRSGGSFPPLDAASRFGLGATLGTGRQPMPWVHLEDAVAALRWTIDKRGVEGAVNVVAPGLVSQMDFTRLVAHANGRTARLRIPGRLIKLIAGEAATILLDGQAATPRRLLAAGFCFKYANLDTALSELTRRKLRLVEAQCSSRQSISAT